MRLYLPEMVGKIAVDVSASNPDRIYALIEGIETPDSKTFSEIARKDGIKAALKWRDSRF